MKNPPKRHVTRPLKLRESAQPSSKQNQPQSVVPAFMQFGLEVGEHKYLPTSQAIGNYIDLGPIGTTIWVI